MARGHILTLFVVSVVWSAGAGAPLEPCLAPEQGGAVQVQPCSPDSPPVTYLYGQAPPGAVIVKPGQLCFPPPPPIVVCPGAVTPPSPPPIWVKPAPVQPPTPAPVCVRPPPVQPPCPRPFYVRVPPVTPPPPAPILVRPPPVPVPRPAPLRVQPGRVHVPPPDALLVTPPRIAVPAPPTIVFRPNPPTSFRSLGAALIQRRRQGPQPDDGSAAPCSASLLGCAVDDPCDPCVPQTDLCMPPDPCGLSLESLCRGAQPELCAD